VTDGARTQILYVAVGAVVAALIYASLYAGADLSDVLHGEDKLIEYLGAIALLVGAVAFFLCFLRVRSDPSYHWIKKASFLALAIVFVFGAGEEVSWGQRLLGVDTPDALAEQSTQDELNFHNLDFLGIFSFENIFQLFWLAFGVLIPVVATVSRRAREFLDRLIPILPVWLAGLFLVQQAIAEVVEANLESNPDRYHAEAAGPIGSIRFEATETILSMLLAVGALLVLRQVRAETDQAPAPEPVRA
jgi:hypothetical protein